MASYAAARAASHEKARDKVEPRAKESLRFGHVVSVSGSQAIVSLDATSHDNRIEIGALVKIPAARSSVVGIVSGLSSPMPVEPSEEKEIRLLELNLAGEITTDEESGQLVFRRGVSNSPALGDAAAYVNRDELASVYRHPKSSTIDIGTLFQDPSVSAHFLVDELFGKHFLVVGSTGSGKSCAITAILQRVLEEHSHAHIVVLDVHNEYAQAFGDRVERINANNLRLPFWLLNFQEICAALTGNDSHHDAEVQILSEAIIAAKRRSAGGQTRRLAAGKGAAMTVDTPAPYLLSDLIAYLDEQLGRLERVQVTLPYLRLKNRIEALIADARYGFMFRGVMVEDTMASVLGQIFRIPAENKPITVIELASVPAEILDVVISLIARLAFDLAVWSEGRMPMLLVCEEAHRYAPSGDGDKFMPTRLALARIAKEGRKYGVALGLATQRPSELDTTIISQCSTVIAMRLSTDRDQDVMRSNTHDGALDLLSYLPVLGDREAIVLGQGVPMPMRIRFRDLGETAGPRSRKDGFSAAWRNGTIGRAELEEIVALWRTTGRFAG